LWERCEGKSFAAFGSAPGKLVLLKSVLDNGMNVAGVDPYFQQSILGSTIIVPSYDIREK
jgi:predicted ABC-type sugar transport system permease subunit